MKKILVIEESPKVIEGISVKLNELYWASSFVRANDCLRKIDFDLIIINISIYPEAFHLISIMAKKSKVVLVAPMAIADIQASTVACMIEEDDVTITSSNRVFQIVSDLDLHK